MRGIGLVSPFCGEDVLDTSVSTAAASETLHWDAAGGPYHSFSLAIPVEFNSFLMLVINPLSIDCRDNSTPCQGTFWVFAG